MVKKGEASKVEAKEAEIKENAVSQARLNQLLELEAKVNADKDKWKKKEQFKTMYRKLMVEKALEAGIEVSDEEVNTALNALNALNAK